MRRVLPRVQFQCSGETRKLIDVRQRDTIMATMNKADLVFVLDQIKIAEAHAAGTPLTDLVVNPLLNYGLRTVDGTDNNLIPGQSEFGAADNLFPRALDPVFSDDQDGDNIFGITNTNYANSASVADADPRTVSNLIADQTATNPAAIAAANSNANSSTVAGTRFDGTPFNTFLIPNETPDVALSAPFNSWFTLFGQFFDHELDLVTKGGNGTVYKRQKPDDPLYVEGSPTNFMVVTRATNQPGPDNVLGTADDIHEATNTTTPFVDQNQTYTSHPSHQVFLREYEMVNGHPVATGKMLEGAASGLANWAEIKAQAANMLGIQLDDQDILSVPLLATDAYGEFIPHPISGFAQIVTSAGPPPQLGSGTPAAPIDATSAVRTGHAFLDDIAHHAAPGGGKIADADTDQVVDDNLGTTYDNELLDAHFITGDGRGNENIGLTTVHHMFHSEHNRQVDELKQTILDSGDPAFIAQWHLPDGSWDGERVFQAAKFATEMQYQHLVFEEFARKVQPNVNLFANYQTEIDPSIVAEFAHTVYRFGHSMLTEEVARTNADGSPNDIGLIQAFLNPLEFNNGGTAGALTSEAAAGAVIRGMTRQVGNEIDEFVTEALRNNLVGLPLDLPAINIARGRETGVPSLNAARRDFFDATGDSQLQPYDNWFKFGLGLRHAESLINFIAAYGTHAELNAADVDTLVDKRAIATALVLGGNAVVNAGACLLY